jgi:hypothetical protein
LYKWWQHDSYALLNTTYLWPMLCFFCNFFCKKMFKSSKICTYCNVSSWTDKKAFYLKTNVMLSFLREPSGFWAKPGQFFACLTSTPDARCYWNPFFATLWISVDLLPLSQPGNQLFSQPGPGWPDEFVKKSPKM